MSRSPDAGGAPATAPRRNVIGLRRFRFTAFSGLLGAAVAGAYAHFIGCRTGSCPLTSNVWTASTYGALVDLLVGWPGRGGSRQAE
jgi:hypothetical protein